jgi:hypothetical protein
MANSGRASAVSKALDRAGFRRKMFPIYGEQGGWVVRSSPVNDLAVEVRWVSDLVSEQRRHIVLSMLESYRVALERSDGGYFTAVSDQEPPVLLVTRLEWKQ